MSEILFNPPLGSFVVKNELMHVVAQISKQVFCFCEARLLLLGILGLEEIHIRLLFVFYYYRTTVLGQLFLHVVMTVN